MKNSLRFNPPKEWNIVTTHNRFYIGLNTLIVDLVNTLNNKSNTKMLEIGSYKGESTFMFASSGIFDEIHCIDPHKGDEQANDIFDDNWKEIQAEFKLNTRHFNNITLHQDYSYNIVNKFKDGYFDFIYIDGSHKYEDVKRDLELYLPKTKHLIAGHDYQTEWPGVIKAVEEIIGKPHKTYIDKSWAYSII